MVRKPHPSDRRRIMFYIIFFSVFITLFLIAGALSLHGFLELMRGRYPLGWTCYQHVFVLAIVALVCLILAVVFGIQIPNCYA